jgi:hypothetical protein
MQLRVLRLTGFNLLTLASNSREVVYSEISPFADPAVGRAFRRWWGVEEDVAREPKLAVTCDAP